MVKLAKAGSEDPGGLVYSSPHFDTGIKLRYF